MEKSILHISTGPKCNNNCVFCLDRWGKEIRCEKEMNINKVRKILEERIKRTNRVLFTSGEPTLNKNLPKFTKLARDLGYKEIALVTNGRMLMYKNLCIELIESGMTTFTVSIHGYNKKLHNSQTRTKGSFEQTLKGLYNLFNLRKEYKFTLKTASTITKINYKDIYSLVKFLLKFMPNCIILNPVIPTGNALFYFDKVVPNYSEVTKNLRLAIKKLSKEGVKDIPLSVIDFPFCLMKDLEKYIGYKEDIILDLKEDPELHRQGLVKRKECSKCIYDLKCRGVFFGYINKEGWDEFKPVI